MLVDKNAYGRQSHIIEPSLFLGGGDHFLRYKRFRWLHATGGYCRRYMMRGFAFRSQREAQRPSIQTLDESKTL